MIVFAAIMPHPTESIPGIGTNQDSLKIARTLDSFEKLRRGLEEACPDTIIIISPHAELERYSFVINSASDLSGSFAKFGLEDVHMYKNNVAIADKINYACEMNELPAVLRGSFLDHGALIPLFHLTKNIKPKVVHLAFSLMSYESNYRYGEIIQKVIDSVGGRIAVIASADLSHRLTVNAPAGYSPSASEFDHSIIRFLGANDLTSIMGLEKDVVKEAAECGIRSIVILLGILHGMKYDFQLLSYEGPFGIGYMTARLL